VDDSQTIRVSVEEAARLLGIEKGSVKKRIQRDKLRSEKAADGTLYVYVDRSETVQDESAGRSQTDRDELVDELRRTNELLRDVISTRDEEIRRRDVIISQLTERIPAIEAPSEASEAAEADEEQQQGRGQPHSATGEAQEPSEGLRGRGSGTARGSSWWRRMFGG
jgi:hypothetical protein